MLYIVVRIIFRGSVVAFVMLYLFLRYRDSDIRDKALHKFYYGTYLGDGSIKRVKIIGFVWMLIIIAGLLGILLQKPTTPQPHRQLTNDSWS